MTCFISRNLLTELVDDALADAREAELREHLAGCAACSHELQELRRTRGMLRSLPVRRAPADFLSKVRAKAERKSPLERISLVLAPVLRLPRPAVGGLALAASLMVAVTVAIRHDERPEGIFGYSGGPSSAKVVSGPAESRQQEGDVDGAPVEELPVAGAPAGFAETKDEATKNQPGRLGMSDNKLATQDDIRAKDLNDATLDLAKKAEFKSKTDSGNAGPSAVTGGLARESAGSGRSVTQTAAPAPAPTPAAKPGLYASTPGADRTVAKAKAPVAAPAEQQDMAASFSESSPEPAFDVESTTVASRGRDADKGTKESVAGKKRNDRRMESERPSAAAAPADVSAGEEVMGAPVGDDWGGGSGSGGGDSFGTVSADSVPADAPSATVQAEKAPAPAKVAQVSTGAVATLNARFSSGAANGPAIVADAARAAGGKLISGNPPALGKSGASTNVVVELAVASVPALEEALDAQGTLDIQGTPSGSRVRLRIEVVRE